MPTEMAILIAIICNSVPHKHKCWTYMSKCATTEEVLTKPQSKHDHPVFRCYRKHKRHHPHHHKHNADGKLPIPEITVTEEPK